MYIMCIYISPQKTHNFRSPQKFRIFPIFCSSLPSSKKSKQTKQTKTENFLILMKNVPAVLVFHPLKSSLQSKGSQALPSNLLGV